MSGRVERLQPVFCGINYGPLAVAFAGAMWACDGIFRPYVSTRMNAGGSDAVLAPVAPQQASSDAGSEPIGLSPLPDRTSAALSFLLDVVSYALLVHRGCGGMGAHREPAPSVAADLPLPHQGAQGIGCAYHGWVQGGPMAAGHSIGPFFCPSPGVGFPQWPVTFVANHFPQAQSCLILIIFFCFSLSTLTGPPPGRTGSSGGLWVCPHTGTTPV